MNHIPYGKQWIDEDDIKAVCEAMSSDFITTGPRVEEFEALLASYVGAKYAVVVNSGTSALHAAYSVAGVSRGDEVITSPMTFAATANAAVYLQAKPVFADIDYSSGIINHKKIEDAISSRTKVIAPVDFAGLPVDIDAIKAIAEKNQLVMVEDAAHSLGATYKGQKVGSLADMTILSFHPVKHITTGEGGVIITNNPDFYKKLLMFRSHGIERNTELQKEHGSWYYEMQTLGYNYRITDIQCALGISQLKKLDKFVDVRRAIALQYSRQLAGLKDYIELPADGEFSISSWHLYAIKVRGGARDRRLLFDYLQFRDIGVQVHYLPVYWHPFYQRLGYPKGLCPEAERFYSNVLSLPIFPKMTNADIVRVCTEIYRYFGVKYLEQ